MGSPSQLSNLANRVRMLLAGEPLRAIVYGSAVVVWLVVGVANALGYTTFGPSISLDNALVDATAAAALLTEISRRFVYSPLTAGDLYRAEADRRGQP